VLGVGLGVKVFAGVRVCAAEPAVSGTGLWRGGEDGRGLRVRAKVFRAAFGEGLLWREMRREKGRR
jgi:hypothetical protein